jgi:hypothetical protein
MSLKISRILHAGYVFECGSTQIVFDPILENPFSRNCFAYPDVHFDYPQIRNLKFSAIFISHFHDDHCSLQSLDLFDRKTPIYLYCTFDELGELIKELGFTEVHQLALDHSVQIGQIEVIPKRALDSDVDAIFHIRAAGVNVLNVVDAWIDPSSLRSLQKTLRWDIILWPFQTMREIEVLAPSRFSKVPPEIPYEWIDQLKILNPKYIVPSSCQFLHETWSWYNHALFPISYRHFRELIQEALPESQIFKLNPSVSISLSPTSLTAEPPLTWVKPVGEQDVDYDYQPSFEVPQTSEIARRFAPLPPEQTEIVFEYCRAGLLSKYRSMDPPKDPYFSQPRIWRLSVYDHEGQVTEFHFNIHGSSIRQCYDFCASISWATEVAGVKLYAALKLGESLTSMYLRINDVVFDSETENQVRTADILEDPLIRCLFSGTFGAYQMAQLQRLRASASSS